MGVGNSHNSNVIKSLGKRNLSESESLPVISRAPELENEIWLNAEEPIRLSELEDKVVLIEMWTFG